VISSDERGLFMGTQQTFGGITRGLFPLGAGLLYDHVNHGAPFWAASILVLVTLLLGFNLEAYMKPESAAKAGTGSAPPSPMPAAAEVASVAPAGSGRTD
jgi:MFS family permease